MGIKVQGGTSDLSFYNIAWLIYVF